MHRFVPTFGGETLVADEASPGSEEGKRYLRLSNVLAGFMQPFVMDVKVGVRSYAESECKNTKPRKDLFQRLFKMDPGELTPEEREAESITKFRWMAYRDAKSSSASLGFRIDGMAGPGNLKLKSEAFREVHEREQVVQELLGFLPPPRKFRFEKDGPEVDQDYLEAMQDTYEEVLTKIRLAKLLVEELTTMRTGFEKSDFFAKHEFVGASLLFVVDTAPTKARVMMIDFAKVKAMKEGCNITHRAPWVLGNHEDGVLFGIDTCIGCWEDVIRRLETEAEERALKSVDEDGDDGERSDHDD